MTRTEREQIFERWLLKLRTTAANIREKIPPELSIDLIKGLSEVIPSKAASYVTKLNTGEIISASHEGLKANFTVVPDKFLTETERKKVQEFLRKPISPSRQVLTFSEFKKWAVQKAEILDATKAHFLGF